MESIISRHHRSRFWLITIAAVLGVGVTAALGVWQLERAAQKNTLQGHVDSRAQQPVLEGESLLAQKEQALDREMLIHRRVQLRGTWLPQHTVYLDNRQMQGRPGFFVLTPLQLESQAGVVLVQRGWVPRDFQQRERLPPVQTPVGSIQLQGRVAPGPSKLYEFADDRAQPRASRIRQNLDLNAFRIETQLPLAALTVLQAGDPSEGLVRDWPVVNTGVEKHYGYAFQWFGLCGLIALLYVWFQFVRRDRSPSGHGLT
jgi:surfeit locus 1 family protein